jgi:glycosyltransferase involved in cell wall biosynthesis
VQVVYDISTLGIGHSRLKARTGVFRVVENVARGLQQSDDCALSFCATQSRSSYFESLSYLRTSPGFETVPMLRPGSTPRGMHSLASAGKFIHQDWHPQRLWLPAHRVFWKAVNTLGGPGLAPRFDVPSEGMIFHSPFSPLPDEISGPGVVRFLTVYDMLPVLYPELFPGQMRRLFHQILNSVRPNDWILTISESTKNDFCEMTNFDPDRVSVTYLGGSPHLFHPGATESDRARVRLKYGLPDAPYILSLNTLEPRKNVHTAIRAFASLVAETGDSQLRFVLVGTHGWKDHEIDQAMRKSPVLRHRVHVAGYIADEDLAAVYSGALMFVYIPLYEGFGLPPLEAMQCGVPVITSNTSSLPEVVGDAALTVDPEDVPGVAAHMWSLYDSQSLRAELRRKGTSRAELFSWERCTNDTLAAYARAIDAA